MPEALQKAVPQKVEEVLPNAIHDTSTGGIDSVRYHQIVQPNEETHTDDVTEDELAEYAVCHRGTGLRNCDDISL